MAASSGHKERMMNLAAENGALTPDVMKEYLKQEGGKRAPTPYAPPVRSQLIAYGMLAPIAGHHLACESMESRAMSQGHWSLFDRYFPNRLEWARWKYAGISPPILLHICRHTLHAEQSYCRMAWRFSGEY